MKDLITFSITHDHGSHILIVLPISTVVIYLNRRDVFSIVRRGLLTGSVLLVTAITALTVTHHKVPAGHVLFSFQIAALVLLWISGFVLAYGSVAFRRIMFPAFLLLLLIPIPDALLETIVSFLQAGSTAVSYHLLKIFHVPVFKEQFVLLLPTLKVEVAKECSGIRSSLALLITALLIGEFALKSKLRRTLLVVCTLPIVLVKNGLRIVTISLLTMYVDPAFLHGWLHTSGGVLFYLVGIMALLVITLFLRRSNRRQRWTGDNDDSGVQQAKEITNPKLAKSRNQMGLINEYPSRADA